MATSGNSRFSAHPSVTAPPGAAKNKVSGSMMVWLILLSYLVLVKILLDLFLPHAFADPAQASLFGWAPLLILAVLGSIGVWLTQKTGFPDAWDRRITQRQRLLLPIIIGAGFAILLVAVDRMTGFTRLIAARHGVTQQYTDFPSMLLIFTAGAIIVEVVYRLFLMPLLLWLISNVLLKNQAQTTIFWGLAVLTSALEPFTQFPDLQVLSVGVAVFLGFLYFMLNFTQAAFFWRAGLLAAILVRVGFYLVWHVFYIH